MRTTIELDHDTADELRRLGAADGRGVSSAVNELIRRGMLAPHLIAPFIPRTHVLGLKFDVSNVADALDLLEGPDAT